MRLATQIIFTLAVLSVTFGFVESPWAGRFIGGLHLFPAFERIAANSIDWFLPIFAGFLILTRIRGRFYCSRLCPVGMIQDLSGRYLAALLNLRLSVGLHLQPDNPWNGFTHPSQRPLCQVLGV